MTICRSSCKCHTESIRWKLFKNKATATDREPREVVIRNATDGGVVGDECVAIEYRGQHWPEEKKEERRWSHQIVNKSINSGFQ